MPKVRTRLRQNPPAAIVLLCVLHLVLLGADCPARHQPPPSRSTSLPSTPSQSTPSQSTSSRSTASSRVRSGVLRGLVTDEVDAVIVGAVVTARSVNGGERTAQTNRAGVFIFDNLAPGSYAVSAVAGGFATYINSAVEIAPGRRARLNIRLSVTLRGERVRVLSEATVSVEPDGNENAIRLRGSDLEALPFETGDQVDALRALAGPASGPDGAQVYTDGFTGGRVPPRDSIREVRINQNPFSAEYDRLGTNRIEFLTKAGSGKLRGQATFGGMDARLNSRNPFAPNRAPFRSSTGAANLSGPLFKRRSSQASFFVDAERRGTDENGVINARVLDDDLRITPFSLVVLTPQRRTTFSPRVDYQLNERHTFAGRYADTQTRYRNAGVGDFSLPSRAYDTSGTEQVVQLTETAILGARAINETRFQFIRARREERGDNSVPTIRVLDAFTGGGAQVGLAANDDDRWELHNYTTFAAGRHTIRAGGRLRRIRVRDISASNFGGTYTFGGGLAPQLDAANEVVRDERGTVVRGAVSSLERYRRTQLFQRTGRTAADIRALGGGATQFSIAGGDPLAGVGQRDLGLFVQDDWRVRPDLTLSAGLRYEAQTNVGGGLDLAPRVAFAWSPSARANGSSGGKDKQPPRMVVRGGFGVFYERFGENFTLQATRFDGVRQQQFVVTDPRILDLFPGVPSIETLRAFAIRQTTRRVAPDARPPYTMQTSVSVERLLPLKLLLTTTFTNTRALHVLRSRNINAPLPGTFQAGVNGSGVRPFVDLGNIFQYETGGRFRQNQLAFALSKRFNPRLSLTGGYTLNKAETDTDGAGTFPADTYDLSSEMGRAVTDVRHHLTLTGTIDAPWGMRLSPLIVATSGRPFNITTGRDTNGDTLFTERPAFAIEPGKTGVVVTRYGAFDPNPAPGQRLIPRNYADGPSFFLVNLRLSRSFNFSGIGDLVRRRANGGHGNTNNSGGAGGKSGADNNNKARPAANRAERIYSLTFSVQAQNLLNHTNAGIPVGNLRSTFFGQSNMLARGFGFGDRPSAGNRRVEAQVTLRF